MCSRYRVTMQACKISMLHLASPCTMLPIRIRRKTWSLRIFVGVFLALGGVLGASAQEEADATVARVSSGEELQAALADSSVVHVVITSNLNLVQAKDDPSSDLSLPMLVSGATKTIRVRVMCSCISCDRSRNYQTTPVKYQSLCFSLRWLNVYFLKQSMVQHHDVRSAATMTQL